MVATFLQDALVKEFNKIFDGFLLKDPTGERVPINVFAQYLPVPKAVKPPKGDLDPALVEEGLAASAVSTVPDPYPYIIVRVSEGEIQDIDGEQTVQVVVIIGVYDDDLNNQGYKDVLNIIQKIYERFSKSAILDRRYECVMPIDWLLEEDEYYPYYIGGLNLNFQTLEIRREDPYA